MSTKTKLLSLSVLLTALLSCKSTQIKHAAAPEIGLFKVSILYPKGEGKTFDMDYYETKHMPMVAGFLGKNLKYYEIDKGIGGRTPSDEAPYVAIGYFYVYSVAEYQKAIAQNRDAVVNDIKNYTNIQPVVEISEIKQLKYNGNRNK